VAGSVGPYGAALADGSEYRGDYGASRATVAAFHRPRLEVLIDATADLLAVETIPSLAEADLLLELLANWPAARAWFSFTCRDEAHLSEGQPIAEAARLVSSSPQAVAVGVNCVSPSQVDGLLARLADATDLPLVVYPNSGERWDAIRRRWTASPSTSDPGKDARRWRAAGARLIGGCCRTTPETIRTIRTALEDY
jgi:homocysteine S-methyltransferase